MGSLISTVEKIDGLRFLPWPSRPKSLTVVRCDGVLIGKDDAGNLYSDQLGRNFCWCPSNADWQVPIIGCLLKLGVVTKEEQERHLAIVKQNDRRRSAANALSYISGEMDRLGAPLTKTQRARLEAIKGGKDGR